MIAAKKVRFECKIEKTWFSARKADLAIALNKAYTKNDLDQILSQLSPAAIYVLEAYLDAKLDGESLV